MRATAKRTSLRRALLDSEQVEKTILRLVEDGQLGVAQGAELARQLPEIINHSGYILGHLGAHLGIGALRSIMIALPLGSLLRSSWVAGSRLYETLRRNPEKARIHSLPVFLIAIIPFAGYFSYLLPLRAAHADAAYLYANHVAYLRYDTPLAALLSDKPAPLRRLVERIVGVPSAVR